MIRLFGYYPLDSPFLLPRSDYFRYLFFFDSLCSWIVDTRTAFHCWTKWECLACSAATYEVAFSPIFLDWRARRSAAMKSAQSYRSTARTKKLCWRSVRVVSTIFGFKGTLFCCLLHSRQNDTTLSALYSCEAIVMCCHILSLLSHFLAHNLTLYVNHVGVGDFIWIDCVDYFDHSRDVRLYKPVIEKAGHRNVIRRRDLSSGFDDEFAQWRSVAGVMRREFDWIDKKQQCDHVAFERECELETSK